MENNYIIFKPCLTINNSIKKYILCCLFCTKYNYKFINYDDFIKINKINDFKFYQGIDISGSDVSYFSNLSSQDIKNFIISNNFYAFNTLGFVKKHFNLNKLVETDFINKNTPNHGIYIRNMICINNSNYKFFLDNKIDTNLFFDDEKFDYNIDQSDLIKILPYLNVNNHYIELNNQKLLLKSLIRENDLFNLNKKYITFKQNSISGEINLINYLLAIIICINNKEIDLVPYLSLYPLDYDKVTVINELNYLDFIGTNKLPIINNIIIEGKITNCIDVIYEHKDSIINYLKETSNNYSLIINNCTYTIQEILSITNKDLNKEYDLLINLNYSLDSTNSNYYKKFCLVPLLKKLNLINKNIMIICKNKNRIINKTIEYLKINNNLIEFNGTDIEIIKNMSKSKMIISYNNLFYISKILNPEQKILIPYNLDNNLHYSLVNNISYFDITNTKKTYICGCVKNCELYLNSVFNNIEEISNIFNETKIIIAYDHSEDNTLNILYELKKKFENLEILLNNNERSKYNTHNIANARNLILDYIKNDNLIDEFEYFIMIDMDDVCSKKINIDNLNMYFINNFINNWDCLTFNKNDYYDIWALSIDELLFSCWHFILPEIVVEFMKKYISEKIYNSNISDLIDCKSAFNGFGIYKINKFINCEYISNIYKSIDLITNNKINDNINFINQVCNINNLIHTYNLEDCEHRYFHMSSIKKNNSQIKISPLCLFDNNYENNCKLICSRGILKSCDIKSYLPISSSNSLTNYDFSGLKDGSIVYICSYAIKNFSEFIDKIPYKIILVSGDSDCTITYNFFNNIQNFIENPKIIHWFTQNCLIKHPKVSGIPIGLDYHTMNEKDSYLGKKIYPIEQEKLLLSIKNSSKPFNERIIKCYSNLYFTINTNYLLSIIDIINNKSPELIYFEKNKINKELIWKTQSEYAFIIIPYENSLDCHNIWEALGLGCIPIVKKSEISYLFDELPVLIVDDWEIVSKQLLIETIDKFKNIKFNYDKLNLEYWVNIIKSKVQNY